MITPVHMSMLVVLFSSLPVCVRSETTIAERKQAYLEAYAKRPLKQGPNPTTWVDVERWCVAHCCLVKKVRLDEANQYFSEVEWVSLWHGLVADTDVQVTDLLRTYMQFEKRSELSDASKAHLRKLFGEWTVPNRDRNRNADTHYEWPCEYTENHSLNILVASYLIDAVLERDRTLRRQLLLAFLGDRAKWGWSEFHSPRYSQVTAKALTCLADFAPDKSVKKSAEMHLDLLALEFANQSLHHWRGVPFTRGASSQRSNQHNAFFELARFWFGDHAEAAKYAGGNFMAHVFTSEYSPPDAAIDLVLDPVRRGRYLMNEVATTGPERLRVPIRIWVTPSVTMASAQGYGSYYDGCYWTISFASSPNNVVTGGYNGARNLFQHRNVLVTFGTVDWHGALKKEADGDITIGTDGAAFIGHVKLSGDCHLLMVEDETESKALFVESIKSLQASLEDGTIRWTSPAGEKIEMHNQKYGPRWQFAGANVDGRPVRIDSNMLFDTPWLRSVRGSRIVEVKDGKRRKVYDFTEPDSPKVRTKLSGKFDDLPSDIVRGPLGIEMVLIPSGEFPMGSSLTEGRPNERPQRWVNTGQFYMSKLEVSVRQYKAFLEKNPKSDRLPDWFFKDWGKTDDYPISWVSWNEARAFCRWLSRQSGKTYRLPTEAEWEKAAKGFTHRRYPWGDQYDGTQSGTKNGTYAPVGAKLTDVSPFGILDMAGNVWEWCEDEVAGARALRGCGWNFDPDTFRCSYRSSLAAGERSVHIGFRVVLEP